MNCQSRLFLTVFTLMIHHYLVMAVNTNEDIKIVTAINAMNTTWRANVVPPELEEILESSLHETNLSANDSSLPTVSYHYRSFIPASFDARIKWPECREIISRVRNQGRCGSCWALQIAAMLSDRICIGSLGLKRVHLSAEDLMTCCKDCTHGHSCKGGMNHRALKYWLEEGIVSGGEYGSNEGCKPYSGAASLQGKHIPCTKKCTYEKYNKNYFQDKNRGKSIYQLTISDGEMQIRREIMTHGPVAATMLVHQDFKSYKNGVYVYKLGKLRGQHTVKIIGWGVQERTKYWLCTNSYGPSWGGLGGYFKILRGEDHCWIETSVSAGRISKVSPRGGRGSSLSSNKEISSFMNCDVFNLLWISTVFLIK